jgi:hypothetical protein
MRYSTMPQWVYVLPIVLGAGMMLAAVVYTVVSPGPIGIIWLAMDTVFVIVCVRALGTRKDDERVLRDGVRGRATVLGAKTTGAYVNRVPQWVLRVRIDGSGDPYETTLRVLTFAPPVNGDSIDVCIDPQRKTHVVIAGDVASADGPLDVETQVAVVHPAAASAATAGLNPDGSRIFTSSDDGAAAARPAAPADPASTVQMLSDLERMRASGALASDEFESLKRKLLGEA